MERQRDANGRFVKGNTAGISTEVAREYQLRSAEKRKENTAERKTLRETLLYYLRQKEKSGLTRQDRLVIDVLDNNERKMTMKDLRDLADILGELKLDITIEQDTSTRPEIVIE